MVGYSSNWARSWHISSLRFFSHVIGSFFYFTNQNFVIQYGSDGKWKLSWHIFACLVFLFPAFLLFSSLIERLTLAVTRGIITVVLILFILLLFCGGVGEELEWNLSKCHCSVSLSEGQIEIERATILSVVTYNLK